MKTLRFLYMTAADEKEALLIAEALVDKKAVACVNVLPGMRSIYRWEGKVERAQEVVLVAKTTRAQVPRVLELVKRLHSYRVPCVVELPIEGGNPEYLKWVQSEVTAKPRSRKRGSNDR